MVCSLHPVTTRVREIGLMCGNNNNNNNNNIKVEGAERMYAVITVITNNIVTGEDTPDQGK